MTYLSFDPGETSGWAKFNEHGDLEDKGQESFETLCRFLDAYSEPVKIVICEDFRIRRNKAKKFIGNRMETIQALGAIRAFAMRHNAEFILQDSGIKTIAERWTGVKPQGPHAQSHWVDAFSHGAYYLIREGIRKHGLEM